MAIGIINAFKIIQIHMHAGKGHAAGDQLIHILRHRAAILQSGQSIGLRNALGSLARGIQAAVQIPAFRHHRRLEGNPR